MFNAGLFRLLAFNFLVWSAYNAAVNIYFFIHVSDSNVQHVREISVRINETLPDLGIDFLCINYTSLCKDVDIIMERLKVVANYDIFNENEKCSAILKLNRCDDKTLDYELNIVEPINSSGGAWMSNFVYKWASIQFALEQFAVSHFNGDLATDKLVIEAAQYRSYYDTREHVLDMSHYFSLVLVGTLLFLIPILQEEIKVIRYHIHTHCTAKSWIGSVLAVSAVGVGLMTAFALKFIGNQCNFFISLCYFTLLTGEYLHLFTIIIYLTFVTCPNKYNLYIIVCTFGLLSAIQLDLALDSYTTLPLLGLPSLAESYIFSSISHWHKVQPHVSPLVIISFLLLANVILTSALWILLFDRKTGRLQGEIMIMGGRSADRRLKNININLEVGKRYFLLGKNGSGKSSLARILCQIDMIDENKGRHLFSNAKLVNVRDTVYYSFLTVEENLRYFAQCERDYSNELMNHLNRLGLEGHKQMSELSSGEFHKYAIILGLVGRLHDFIVFDEPTEYLDETSRIAFWNIVLELEHRFGIVVITHRICEAEMLADEVFVMNKMSIKRHFRDPSDFLGEEQTSVQQRKYAIFPESYNMLLEDYMMSLGSESDPMTVSLPVWLMRNRTVSKCCALLWICIKFLWNQPGLIILNCIVSASIIFGSYMMSKLNTERIRGDNTKRFFSDNVSSCYVENLNNDEGFIYKNYICYNPDVFTSLPLLIHNFVQQYSLYPISFRMEFQTFEHNFMNDLYAFRYQCCLTISLIYIIYFKSSNRQMSKIYRLHEIPRTMEYVVFVCFHYLLTISSAMVLYPLSNEYYWTCLNYCLFIHAWEFEALFSPIFITIIALIVGAISDGAFLQSDWLPLSWKPHWFVSPILFINVISIFMFQDLMRNFIEKKFSAIQSISVKKYRMPSNEVVDFAFDRFPLILIAPNGTGKTTLAKRIARLSKFKEPAKCFINARPSTLVWPVGLVSDKPSVNFGLSGKDLATIWCMIYNVNESYVNKICDRVEIPNAFMGSASAGTVRKFDLLHAWLLNTALIIYDEPDVHLDVVATSRIMFIIQKHSSTPIIITHNAEMLYRPEFVVKDLAKNTNVDMTIRGRMVVRNLPQAGWIDLEPPVIGRERITVFDVNPRRVQEFMEQIEEFHPVHATLQTYRYPSWTSV